MKLGFLTSHGSKNSVRDKVIGQKCIYLDTERTLHRQSVGHCRGWMRPWSEAWLVFFFFFSFIFISWRLITLQFCSGFCHTLTWISHGFTHPNVHSSMVSFYRLGNMLMSGRITPTILGEGWRFPGFGPLPIPWFFNSALELSWHFWVCHFTFWLRIKIP